MFEEKVTRKHKVKENKLKLENGGNGICRIVSHWH